MENKAKVPGFYTNVFLDKKKQSLHFRQYLKISISLFETRHCFTLYIAYILRYAYISCIRFNTALSRLYADESDKEESENWRVPAETTMMSAPRNSWSTWLGGCRPRLTSPSPAPCCSCTFSRTRCTREDRMGDVWGYDSISHAIVSNRLDVTTKIQSAHDLADIRSRRDLFNSRLRRRQHKIFAQCPVT